MTEHKRREMLNKVFDILYNGRIDRVSYSHIAKIFSKILAHSKCIYR